MSEGRQRENWTHTANVLAVIANVFRAKGAAEADPVKINPFTRNLPQHKPKPMGKISDLKGLFSKGKK